MGCLAWLSSTAALKNQIPNPSPVHFFLIRLRAKIAQELIDSLKALAIILSKVTLFSFDPIGLVSQ